MKHHRYSAAWVAFFGTAFFGVGCARPEVRIPAGLRIEGYEIACRRIAADPVAFLRESLEEARKLKAYTLTFQRQERLGWLRELRPQETIAAEYRDDPFSVRFTWLDENSEFKQCVYVRGKNRDQVLLLPRKGPLGEPPKVESYPPDFAVLFAKARNPITDFGPRRMLERTLDRIEKAKAKGNVSIRLLEPTEVGPAREPCFRLELRYPPGDPFPCKLQDLYIHATTRLPVATYLWLPGKIERCGDTLDAMYVYAALRPLDALSDAHFRIDGAEQAGKPAGRETATVTDVRAGK